MTDPVLSCLALTPLVLVDKVPGILYTKECLARLEKGYTELKCLNHTLVHPMGTWANTLLFNKQIRNHQDLDHVLVSNLIAIQLMMSVIGWFSNRYRTPDSRPDGNNQIPDFCHGDTTNVLYVQPV